jgi:hypothetical protein
VSIPKAALAQTCKVSTGDVLGKHTASGRNGEGNGDEAGALSSLKPSIAH